MRRSWLWRRVRRVLFVYAPLIVVLALLLLPLYWMVITSFRSEADMYSNAYKAPLIVRDPSLRNYAFLFQKSPYARFFLNSVVITAVTTAVSLFLSILAGYAIARLRFSGAAVIGVLIFVTYLVPRTLTFVPMSILMQNLGLYGKPASLFLVYPTFVIPFCTWLLSGYFRTIPMEPEECAMVDGCSRLGAIRRITVPLAIPGILTAGIFAFTLSWNELLYALVLVSGERNRTLALGVVTAFTQGDFYFLGPVMAGATLGSLPVAIAFFFFMDLYVSGLTAGAVKG